MTTELHTERPVLLSDLLRGAGINIGLPCGGHGRCGKCRVTVSGDLLPPTGQEKSVLTAEELSQGVRLACCAWVHGNVVVSVPQSANDQTIDICDTGMEQLTASDPAYERLGVAIDIGTTTLAAQLYEKNVCIAKATAVNPQRAYGADVISRIESALSGKAAELARCIRTALGELIGKLCESAGREIEGIDGCVITGNTTMLFLLTGIDTEPLSHAPFEVPEYFGRTVFAEELELPLKGDVPVYIPKCISAFVGADITTALLASGICEHSDTAMLADIGTNGELALWHNGELFSCSTAAGPAFEGANLECGMQGNAGAIDHAWIHEGKLGCHVIGESAPVGICGSGIADLVACMLKLDELDESGCLTSDNDRYSITDQVFVSQKDIRQIQLAKSAVCAGMLTLLSHCKVELEKVSSLEIAGGFGNFLSLDSAADIGLIPRALRSKSHVIGNASLTGAAMLLKDKSLRIKSEKLASMAISVDLAANPIFMDHYIDGMQFEL